MRIHRLLTSAALVSCLLPGLTAWAAQPVATGQVTARGELSGRRTVRKIGLLLFAATVLIVSGAALAATGMPAWSLIPVPAEVHPAFSGSVELVNGDRVLVQSRGNRQVLGIARQFARRVAAARGLYLRVGKALTATSATRAAIVFDLDPAAHVEGDAGYRIIIGSGQIRVVARAPRGLFYGGVTLWQLLTPHAARKTSVRVADGTIIDHPRFKWRGLMLDSARHFQSVADIEKLLDWMSLHKLNVLHWHLTDDQGWRLQVPKYPELTKIGACRKAVGPDAALTGGPGKPYCGFYTEAEVRRVVRYAAERFITIVPEIDIPGHSQAAIAAYPWLGVTGKRPPVSTDWGINTWLLKPDARTLEFVDDVMDEVMKLFPSADQGVAEHPDRAGQGCLARASNAKAFAASGASPDMCRTRDVEKMQDSIFSTNSYIHIGGDEAAKDQWNASPEVRAHMRALGLKNMDALQGWFTTQVANYLTEHGRTAVGWDEILQGKVPASTVVMSWHEPEGALQAIEQGHDVVMSSSPTLYLDHYQSDLHDEPPGRPGVESLQDIYDYNPTPKGAAAAQARHVLGVQANLWTEYMPTFARVQHAVFPRITALSEVAWSPASTHDWRSFLERMPAELARYRALGIDYADSAFAPAFALQAGPEDTIDVALSNQAAFGSIRYTTDGGVPTANSSRYTSPLSFPSGKTTTLRAATFAADGFELAAPRTQVINAAALLTRNSDQLDTCKKQLMLRLEDDRPLHGKRPVYRVDIENMCWLWKDAPLDGVHRIALAVGNLPWNFALWTDNAKVVTRPKATPAGEFQIHEDSCTGPLLATLPLAQATRTKLQTTLTATIPAITGKHTLCVFATGDPRQGLWAVGNVRLMEK